MKTFTILGEGIAVFRGENGRVYAVDAYCPHLGANLGVGGRVIGELVCIVMQIEPRSRGIIPGTLVLLWRLKQSVCPISARNLSSS